MYYKLMFVILLERQADTHSHFRLYCLEIGGNRLKGKSKALYVKQQAKGCIHTVIGSLRVGIPVL